MTFDPTPLRSQQSSLTCGGWRFEHFVEIISEFNGQQEMYDYKYCVYFWEQSNQSSLLNSKRQPVKIHLQGVKITISL